MNLADIYLGRTICSDKEDEKIVEGFLLYNNGYYICNMDEINEDPFYRINPHSMYWVYEDSIVKR